ncbi:MULTISPECIES: response regulator [Bradyrhizobium]|uniref:response regulator n=1 Tax=Bradyrhizobium TaxID=374 RepID=UPI0006769212|nr:MULTISPECIES: response regulator [Bradyrhizobium]MBR0944385.1 response regulator [Bradyrhizobium liaoningense]MBR1030708.1 response regulator [Bradyrhizobium liaoningense]MDI2074294.1 response regulator [Bradyrhizobium sp. Mp27]
MPRVGGKRVGCTSCLVVEDEYPLQGLVEEALREGGFETAILSSGEEALTLFRGRVAPYRALVTDVNLKGSLSGWDVARQIREMEAAFPVIYMTGARADQWTSHGGPDSILLRKPFAPAQLVTAVSQLLNAAGPTAE